MFFGKRFFRAQIKEAELYRGILILQPGTADAKEPHGGAVPEFSGKMAGGLIDAAAVVCGGLQGCLMGGGLKSSI